MPDFSALLTLDGIIGLITLTLLELVLGIDNIVFISIIAGRLPVEKQKKARNIGLALAMIMRIALLFGITWIIGLKEPMFTVFDHGISAKDMILIAGGLFLMYKSTTEIHKKITGLEEDENSEEEVSRARKISMSAIIFQIVLIDIVFSFDSVLTAVGLTDIIATMILAVIISIIVMMIFAGKIASFVNKHPSIKMLALSFLLMIGLMLVIEGVNDPHIHIPKGYIYFGMAYALVVELLNMRVRRKKDKSDNG